MKKSNRDVPISDLIETLNQSANAMREKLIKEIPNFKDMPLSQEATTTQGEKVMKANPAPQEFRGLVRDYATIVKLLNELDKNGDHVSSEKLSDIRSRFMVNVG